MNTKKLFFFAIAALGLAACSNDEVVEVNSTVQEANTISFRGLVNGQTRASSTSDITSANINTFKVTAYQSSTCYINDIAYTNNGSGTFFVDGTSAVTNKFVNEYYWPAAGDLDFYAYYPTDVTKADYKTRFRWTPATGENPTHQDLIYACTKGQNKSANGASGVALNFRHACSKIAVRVTNSAPNLKFTVDGWKVAYLDPTGMFTFKEDATTSGASTLAFTDWVGVYDADSDGNTDDGDDLTTASISTWYSSTASAKNIAAYNGSSLVYTDLDGQMILVPQTLTAATAYSGTTEGDGCSTGDGLNGSYIAVKLTIMDNTNGITIADDFYDSNDDSNPDAHRSMWAIWPIGGYKWEPGKIYTYTIDLADGGYFEKNTSMQVSSTTSLDPILQGAIIKFVSVTVDTWDPVAKSVPES